jgi:uncharacterized protein YbjT (DUF2867 family)
MNLVVFGATGATGKLVVEQALAAGHYVTALVRSPRKLTITHPNLRVVTGDATDVAAVTRAMEGADAVITTIGAPKGPVVADSTRAILAGARQQGVKRVVMLSSFAVERDRLKPFTKFMTGVAMGAVIKDKAIGEEALRASDRDWTIVYATLLTNGPATRSVSIVPQATKIGMSQNIPRADVAAWLLDAATGDGQYSRKDVTITVGV